MYSEIYLLYLILWCLIWGIVSYSIMKSKGHTKQLGLWFICGALLSIIGVLIAAVQPNLNNQIVVTKNDPQDNPKSLKDELKELDELFDSGLITRGEYDTRRSKLINRV